MRGCPIGQLLFFYTKYGKRVKYDKGGGVWQEVSLLVARCVWA